MNTTASAPFFVPSTTTTDRLPRRTSRSLNPVVQAIEVVIGTAGIAAGAIAVLGVVHALITLA